MNRIALVSILAGLAATAPLYAAAAEPTAAEAPRVAADSPEGKAIIARIIVLNAQIKATQIPNPRPPSGAPMGRVSAAGMGSAGSSSADGNDRRMLILEARYRQEAGARRAAISRKTALAEERDALLASLDMDRAMRSKLGKPVFRKPNG